MINIYTCKQCSKPFERPKNQADFAIRRGRNINYCSLKCTGLSTKNKITLNCTNCSRSFEKIPSAVNAVNNFCSQSCSATHRNRTVKVGVRRSKAEKYLEDILTNMGFELICNSRQLIPSGLEIDIYVKDLNLAIELNGPVHYLPIYGEDKLLSTQTNDEIKRKESIEAGYRYSIIDVTQSRFEDTKRLLDVFASTLIK